MIGFGLVIGSTFTLIDLYFSKLTDTDAYYKVTRATTFVIYVRSLVVIATHFLFQSF